MSTRRLITLALLCGLAILVAGGVWLVQAGSTDDRIEGLDVGTFAEVGGLRVAVLGFPGTADSPFLVDVEMKAGDVDVEDPSVGWAALGKGGRVERDDSISNACAGRDLPARGTLRCQFALQAEPGESALVVVYTREGETAVWPYPYGSG